MNSGWIKATLGDFIRLQRGHDLPESERREGQVPVIGSAGITGYHDTARAKGPGVTVGRSGASFGVVNYSPVDYWPHNAALYVTDFQGNDERFAYYFLKSINFKNFNSGSAQQSLNRNFIYPILVNIPPLSIQHRIAAILSAYDDLIENNTRRIQILEEMARRIYEEWFVRFRFPGYEDVKMVESELGLIPNGWKVAHLKDIVTNIRNSTKAGSHLFDRHYVPIECISRESLALTEFFSWEEAQSSLILFEERDILFGAMRPYFHKVTVAPFRGVTRTTCFVLKPKFDFLHSFAVLTLFSDSTVSFASTNSNGATIPYAVWDGVMENMKIVLPPKSLLTRYDEIVNPMLETIRKSIFKQNNLRRTRDLLLPKLISGEIDVSNFPEPVSD